MSETRESEQAWFDRELARLEADHERSPIAVRLRAYRETLWQLLRQRPPTRSHLSQTLGAVARLSAQALSVQRTSVWLFRDGQTRLHCMLELVHDRVVTASGSELFSESCPTYIEALAHGEAVDVEDAQSDPRTVELLPYLNQHDVRALLDIPIVIPGEILGVVCHEQTGALRNWSEDEVDFASVVGHVIAIALETERRLDAEYAARGTEAKYRHLVESLPGTVYSFNTDTGKLDYISPRVFDLGGFAGEALLAEGVSAWLERIHPDDRRPVEQRLEGGSATGFPEALYYRIRLPDGGSRWVQDLCSVVRDASGRPVAVQGVLTDVTLERAAQAASREFARRYRTLLENIDMVAVSLDRFGRATFVNDAFVALSGYAREDLLGADWFELVIPHEQRDSVRERFLRDIRSGRVVPRFELEIVTRSGQRRLLLCANTTLKDPLGVVEGTSSLALDITDRRTLDTALLQQTKLESLGRLSASLAHDFNNLLTVLMTQLGLLRRPNGDPEKVIGTMEQALRQASELTRALLLYGRKQPPRKAVVEMDQLIEESRALLQAMASSHIPLELVHQARGARVYADVTQVRQVLFNLVTNAADALVDRGGHIWVQTRIERVPEADARKRGVRQGGDFVVVSVTDDGAGMDRQTLERIFEPFYTTKGEGEGTGLGLAISQTAAAENGGFITVDSEPGKGTTFRAYFRCYEAAEAGRAAGVSGPAPMPGARALVVARDAGVRDRLCGALTKVGYMPLPVSDIRGASRLLASTPPSLILTEENLPDGTGATLARSFRAVRPQARVVLISDSEQEDYDDVYDGRVSTNPTIEHLRDAIHSERESPSAVAKPAE